MLQSVPQAATLQAALSTNTNGSLNVVAVSPVQPPSQQKGFEAPVVVQPPTQVYQYTRQLYAVIVNGVTAQQDPDGNAVGPELSRIINRGPFFSPGPPAEIVAGIPVVGGATNDSMTAQAVAALSSLAGNSGSIFSH